MQGVDFPEANATFGPPSDLTESQCNRIRAYRGFVAKGSLEGSAIVVVAHQPTPEDLAALNAGAPIFLAMIGGLSPHMLGTTFEQVTNPA